MLIPVQSNVCVRVGRFVVMNWCLKSVGARVHAGALCQPGHQPREPEERASDDILPAELISEGAAVQVQEHPPIGCRAEPGPRVLQPGPCRQEQAAIGDEEQVKEKRECGGPRVQGQCHPLHSLEQHCFRLPGNRPGPPDSHEE